MERLGNEELLIGRSREQTEAEMEKCSEAETKKRRDDWRNGLIRWRYKRTGRRNDRRVN